MIDIMQIIYDRLNPQAYR